MKKLPCPACGAEVIFQSSVSVYAVCLYCQSMIVRQDLDLKTLGTMAALPEDMSPLQLGTGGIYQGEHFEIIGRLKVGWENGSWNEWCILTDSMKQGWLAEAQGFFAISFQLNEENQAVTLKNIDQWIKTTKTEDPDFNQVLGKNLLFGKNPLKIVDVKTATCLGSEGELPFPAPKGRQTLSIDLIGNQAEFACIEIDGSSSQIFLGTYITWDDLHFSYLRSLEGWS